MDQDLPSSPSQGDVEDRTGREHPAPRNSCLLWIADVLLILAVFWIHAGEKVPDVNEPHYLTKAKHYWQPAWGEGDFFLESADAHEVFYWTYGWVTQLVSFDAAAWIGRLATWLLLAIAWRRVSWCFVQRPLFAALAAAIFVALTEQADLSGEWIVGGVEAKGFAYVFVLFGLAAALTNRWNVAWLLLGTAAAFHPIVGGWVVVGLGLTLLDPQNRPPIIKMLPGLCLGGFISLIGVLPAMALTRGVPSEVSTEAARIYVFERLPHHLAILEQPAEKLIPMAARHAASIMMFFGFVGVLRGQLGESDGQLSARIRRLAAFVLAGIALTLVGLAIQVAMRNDPAAAAKLLRFYWFRLTDFAAPLGLSLASVTCLAHISVQQGTRKAALLVVCLSLPLWHGYRELDRRWQQDDPRPERKLASAEDWHAALAWIRENTDPTTRFLTPRASQTFKWHTGRPEVINRKDIPQDAAGIVEWQRRMKEAYGKTPEQMKPGKSPFLRSLGHAGKERVVNVAQKYEAEFVLTDRRRPLDLEIAYGNDTYIIYRVPVE